MAECMMIILYLIVTHTHVLYAQILAQSSFDRVRHLCMLS